MLPLPRLRPERPDSEAIIRPRRLRRAEPERSKPQEVPLRAKDLVLPLLVCGDITSPRPAPARPGVFHHTLDSLTRAALDAAANSIGGIMLFGICKDRPTTGDAADPNEILLQALARLSSELDSQTVLMSTVCAVDDTPAEPAKSRSRLQLADSRLLARYRDAALAQAQAGARFLAPADHTDGQLAIIRTGLAAAGRSDVGLFTWSDTPTLVWSGADELACCHLGRHADRPREVATTACHETLRELALDLTEGADLIMVKSELAYQDVLHDIVQHAGIPVGNFQSPEEHTMLETAAAQGWLDRRRAILEILMASRRAGAGVIVTPWATEAASWLREETQ